MSNRCLGCMELFGDEFEICPHCGYIIGTQAEEAVHMEPGTLLYDRYIVGKVLGYGGFGVTYIGWDGKLEQKVAIKEYLPSEFSTRMPGQSRVTVFNGEKNEQFHDGLNKFVEEAKHLAKFQSEGGIVKIFDSFKENDTAYIIMEYLDGETLSQYLKREKTISEDVAVAMLIPVMESLQVVHDEGLLHRDIAPDNIFLTKTGEVKLIDFGASRYATTSHSRSLTVIIKPGYTPEEQYRSRGDQGAYTDVYAIAATLYKMITGKTPPDAMERRAKYENENRDILEEPHKINKNISCNRENAILNAMNVRIEDRTPDIRSFIKDLNADPPVKRVYGKIKKIDLYSWPLWLKILLPSVLSLVLIFGALLLTGIINFSNFSEEIVIPENIVTVPDVESMYKDDALKMIADAKLFAITEGSIESEYIPAGKIILQTPVGGSYIDINGTVLLTISSGKSVVSPENGISTVPYVIWDDKETAKSKLQQAGMGEPEIIEKHDDNVAYGSVISQSIDAGTQVEEGTKITLTVSIGPAAFDMPNVVGMTKEKAEELLIQKGLVVTIEYQKNDSVKEGDVISQSAEEGKQVQPRDEITIVISSGRETIDVPNVVGLTRTEAEKTLTNKNFKVRVLENYDANVEKGKVIKQTPGAGTAQLPGAEIVIFVSKGKQPITVTFDATGGVVNQANMSLYYSDLYGKLPTPTKSGYTFNGWYSAKSGGVKVTDSTIITTPSSHTLYAAWTPNVYTVSFDSNGGSTPPATKKVSFGSEYGNLGMVSRSGYTFVGWFTAKSGGVEILADTKNTTASNQTLYAHWSENGYTVTFDANGGNVSTVNKGVVYGSTYGTLPTPTKNGYVFTGWYTSASGGSKVTSSTTVSITKSQTLYAQWTANSYTLNFNANGGIVSTSSKVITYGSTFGTLPTPIRDYYTFNGWYTAASGGSKVSSSTIMGAGNTTIYAQWSEKVPSDWVKASEVPAGAQIIESKWTYTLREYTTNTSDVLFGWTKYDTQRTGWSEWSNWSTNDPTNGVRNVESQSVYDHTEYHYYRWTNGNGVYTYKYSSSYWLEEKWFTYVLPTTSQYSSIGYVGSDKIANWWVRADYESNHSTDRTFTRTINRTEWRYQEPVYTYFYYRDIEKETMSSDPTSQNNVSNVVKWVKYRAK